MTLSIAEILIALVGTGAATAFITGWFSRRKFGGEASEAFAEAAKIVAEQNVALTSRLSDMALKFTDLQCSNKLMEAGHELTMIELRKRDAKIDLLQMEVSTLRQALGLNNKKE